MMMRSLTVGGLLVAMACGPARADFSLSGPIRFRTPDFNHSGSLVFNGAAPMVADNTALSALSTTAYAAVVRLDHSAGVGSPATVYKASASACPLAAGAGDGGSEVPSSNGTCWLADLSSNGADLRIWGARPSAGSGVDQGDIIRAACAWGMTFKNGTITVPIGEYYLNTLDASGLGAIVMGTGAASPQGLPCHFTGAAAGNHPDTCGLDTPWFLLGPALDRPLVYLRKNTDAPHFTDMCLSGLRANQSGWAGGPDGKLYVVQVEEDLGTPTINSSVKMTRTMVRDGYNGNIYIGRARGAAVFRDVWSMYSGQAAGDYSIYLGGFEAYFSNLEQGRSAGSGILVALGAQYQFDGGAFFLNADAGMVIAGGQVNYMTVNGTNFQWNGCNGVRVLNTPPLAGQNSAGHTFVNPTFEASSESGAGACSDVYIDGRINEHFISPLFIGRASASYNLPKHNIEFNGTGSAYVSSPGWGTLGATGANTSGFSNNYEKLYGNIPLELPWFPTLVGSTGGGVPTFSFREGTWGRSNEVVTATFAVKTTALNAPTGDMEIASLPVLSSLAANNVGSCHISTYEGWTGAGGRTHLGGLVAPNAHRAALFGSGSGLTKATTAVGEFANATELYGTCIYPAQAGSPQ